MSILHDALLDDTQCIWVVYYMLLQSIQNEAVLNIKGKSSLAFSDTFRL